MIRMTRLMKYVAPLALFQILPGNCNEGLLTRLTPVLLDESSNNVLFDLITFAAPFVLSG